MRGSIRLPIRLLCMCLMTHIGSSFGGVTGKIAGSVADRETGEGLPGVEIGLRGSTVFGINAL